MREDGPLAPKPLRQPCRSPRRGNNMATARLGGDSRVGQIVPGVPATAGQVARLFADSLVWDNHACSTLRVGHAHWLSHLKRHHAAGVDVVCMNVGFDAAAATDAVLLLSEFRSWL